MFQRLSVQILDGHFYTFICCKNCKCLFEKDEKSEKDAEDGLFLFKKTYIIPNTDFEPA